MTNKTIIYRYLKSKGIGIKVAYPMAEELSALIEANIQNK
jgi:hypothetical protein